MLRKLGWIAVCSICGRDYVVDDGNDYSVDDVRAILRAASWVFPKENPDETSIICPACDSAGLTLDDVAYR